MVALRIGGKVACKITWHGTNNLSTVDHVESKVRTIAYAYMIVTEELFYVIKFYHFFMPSLEIIPNISSGPFCLRFWYLA